MAIEKMSLVNIVGNLSELDDTLIECVDSGCFHIEQPSKLMNVGEYGHMASSEESNPYAALAQKLYDLSIELSIKLKDQPMGEKRNREALTSYVETLDQKLSAYSARRAALKDALADLELAERQMEHLVGLDNISLDDLFSLKHIAVRFGKLPYENYPKLDYYKKRTFFFFSFDHDTDYYYGAYFVPVRKVEGVDQIFDALMFERTVLPDYAHGTPKASLEKIREMIAEDRAELKALSEAYEMLKTEYADTLPAVYKNLRYLDAVNELHKYVAIIKNKFYIVGYVPQGKAQAFGDKLDALQTVSCVEQDIEASPRLKPPTKLKNGRLFEPFQGFVEMYGLPAYKGIDPTKLVAITYSLLFGIMFGDVGQGLLLSVIGYFMWRLKKMFLGRVLERIGIVSAAFGLVYGSVFGYEHLLDPMYKALFGWDQKPVEVFHGETTTVLLLGAVGLGAVIILISMLINIYVGFKTRNFGRALFDANGLSGFVLYLSAIGAAVLLMLFNVNVLNPIFILLCIVLPLLLIFFRTPLTELVKKGKANNPEGGIGGFIVENFFELFEFVLSYITNTMSFLRVGGFILSHAGMMAVVMTLAEMVGAGASPIVVVIGNLFVMAIEGLIVGIQVLRLEFYEIFSRFYDGDGIPFKPVGVSYSEK